MESLDPRKRIILKAVIVEYVEVAEPVASELIARKYELGVRSATVRNELAEMAEMGYLEQPHTSSGRIPSDFGYRYYVDHLVDPPEVAAQSKARIRGATEGQEAVRELVSETTRTLSRLTHQLAAGLTHVDRKVSIISAVLTSMGPEMALLVCVFSNHEVVNRRVECPAGMTVQDIGKVNETLYKMAADKPLSAIAKLKPETNVESIETRLMNNVIGVLKSIAKSHSKSHVILQGEHYILAQPEFRGSENAMNSVIDSFEQDDLLANAVANPNLKELRISIGRENENPQFESFSILRQNFYCGTDEAGTLAIIGPTRLNYDQNIAMLRYAAQAISDTLTKLQAPSS